MKFEMNRKGIRITPENDQDVAYIEDTLGLKHRQSYLDLSRVEIAYGVFYLETGHRKADEEIKMAKTFLEQAISK